MQISKQYKSEKKPVWVERFIKASGLSGYHETRMALSGTSKHRRGSVKAKNWRERRRKARKIAKASRRRNR